MQNESQETHCCIDDWDDDHDDNYDDKDNDGGDNSYYYSAM